MKRASCPWLRGLLAAVTAVAFACGGGGCASGGGPFLVGAHYYVWYPSNFDQGFLRDVLEPPQAPALGRYNSRSPAVAEQHIAWAASAGIDFFTLDWWPDRPSQNDTIGAGFLRAANVDQIRFCIFYNTFGLGYSDSDGIVFDEATKNRFVSNMETIARSYFGHASYLRVDGRPVVVLYITRVIRGRFPEAMSEMRSAIAAEGYDPFVIGDEIFWLPVEANEDLSAPARITPDPQVSRIASSTRSLRTTSTT